MFDIFFVQFLTYPSLRALARLQFICLQINMGLLFATFLVISLILVWKLVGKCLILGLTWVTTFVWHKNASFSWYFSMWHHFLTLVLGLHKLFSLNLSGIFVVNIKILRCSHLFYVVETFIFTVAAGIVKYFGLFTCYCSSFHAK